MKKLSVVICALTMSAASGLALAGDAAAGKAKAGTCVGCHGATGVSAVPMYPNLAGQKEQYLVTQLKAFKAGSRKNATMNAMVAALSEGDMADLAAYFSSQSCK